MQLSWSNALPAGLLLVLGLTPPAAAAPASAAAQPPVAYLQFDGNDNFVEVDDSVDFSVNTTGALTVSAWMRPDTLIFPHTEDRDGTIGTSRYVHWLGKGTPQQHEWTFRMYSLDNTQERENRISFYVFNPQGGEGIGSYFQEPVTPGEWIHVVGVADDQTTAIYKNGELKRCDQYQGTGAARDGRACQQYAPERWITPQHGTAPLRMAHRDRNSFFEGALAQVRVWNRALSSAEVADLYASGVAPRDGLVAEWLLNEGAGTVANDTAGAHPGTIFGATWGSDAPPATRAAGLDRRPANRQRSAAVRS